MLVSQYEKRLHWFGNRQWQLFSTLTQNTISAECFVNPLSALQVWLLCFVVLVCENHLVFLIPCVLCSTCQACVSNHPCIYICGMFVSSCALIFVIQCLLCVLDIIVNFCFANHNDMDYFSS